MFATRKLTFGLIYGLAGGLVFSVAAWGVNAFLLARAHFAYPWLAFIPGLLFALLLGGLAGHLTARFENTALGGLIWLAAGIFLAVAGVWLPLWIVPLLLPWLDPLLKNWLTFSWQDSYTFLVVSAAIVSGIAFLIVGLLECILLDQASFSPYASAILMPVIVCSFGAALAGGVIDNLVNTRYRNSALALDRVITYALQNQGVQIDPLLSRQMHLGALSAIQSDLSENRRMFYFSFTQTADQGQILVDFNGRWAICDVFLDQPAFCRSVQPPS